MAQRNERRKLQRFDPAEKIVVFLQHEGLSWGGQAVDVSLGGLGAAFPLSRAPTVRPGSNVQLSFGVLGTRPVIATARALHARTTSDDVRLGFEFTDLDQISRQIKGLVRLFKGRWSSPVRPSSPTDVFLTTDAGFIHTTLLDVSIAGARLLMRREDEMLLAEAESVDTCLMLEALPDLLRLQGRVGTTGPAPGGVRVDLQWWLGGAGIAASLMSLVQYIEAVHDSPGPARAARRRA